jgi:hypothetical protein
MMFKTKAASTKTDAKQESERGKDIDQARGAKTKADDLGSR